MIKTFKDRMKNHWVEKYRPKEIDDMILEDNVRDMVSRFIESGEIPHMLFYGDPGSGKTTISKIIIKKLIKSSMDVLWLNGSEQRGIDVIRETILPFISTPPDPEDTIKIVFIDEFDNATPAFYDALRETVEKKSAYCRFLATCNYINRLPPAMQSRFNLIPLKPIDEETIRKYVLNVLEEEKAEYELEYINSIINRYKPDMRRILYALSNSFDGTKVQDLGFETHDQKTDQLMCIIKQMLTMKKNGVNDFNLYNPLLKTMKEIIKYDGETIDYLHLYRKLFYDLQDLITIQMEMVIAQRTFQHSKAPFKAMNFLDCINVMIYQC